MFFVFLGLAIADLLFLALWLLLGLRVNGDTALALRHQVGGLMVCILTVFVHSVTFVYFLGTGLAVKEARRNWGIGADYVRHTRSFKLKAYPIAMAAIALVVATGILGGAARSGAVPVSVHRALAFLSTAASIAAFVVALRLMLRNGFMLALIRGEVARIRARAERGEEVVAPDGARPEALRKPEEVKQPPRGFLAARACIFLGLSVWGLFAYFWIQRTSNPKWADLESVGWVPFAVVSLFLFGAGIYLRIRHPLPAGVEF
jgi:hypothetical protein